MEQIKLKKAKVVEEKNRKLKERMAAAEARRKQDEEQQKKRLQQMEEDKRMAADLAIKRKELEVKQFLVQTFSGWLLKVCTVVALLCKPTILYTEVQ